MKLNVSGVKGEVEKVFRLTLKNSKERKGNYRSVQRVLSLAKGRGYANEEKLVQFFQRVNHYEESDIAHRLLEELFEFVSADECYHLLSA